MQITVTINLVVVTKFFEATYTSIFELLLITDFQENELLRPVSIYNKTVEINERRILYLYCLV